MEFTNINVIFTSKFEDDTNKNFSLPPIVVQRNVTIFSTTLLKNACEVIMNQFKLNNLLYRSQAFLLLCNTISIDCKTFFPESGINVGMVKLVVGEPFTIKIVIFENAQDADKLDIKKLYINCHPFMTINSDLINHCVSNPFLQNPTIDNKNTANQIDENQINLNESFKKGQPLVEMSQKVNNSKSNLLSFNINSTTRGRVRFHPYKETPILEKWYQENKHPTPLDFEVYAYQVNVLSNRNETCKITGENVRTWFQNRRKNKRSKDISMKD